MEFVLSVQALVQAVWCPVFANSFIQSVLAYIDSALLGMMKTSDLFIWHPHSPSPKSKSQSILPTLIFPASHVQLHGTARSVRPHQYWPTWLHIHVKSFLSHELLKELFRLKLLPCSGEIQRLGHSLSYLTSVKVERISMGVGCQLSTSIPYHSPLNGFPVYFSDSFRFKIIFNITWQIMAKNRAVIT